LAVNSAGFRNCLAEYTMHSVSLLRITYGIGVV